jgi:hypothetical protein
MYNDHSLNRRDLRAAGRSILNWLASDSPITPSWSANV